MAVLTEAHLNSSSPSPSHHISLRTILLSNFIIISDFPVSAGYAPSVNKFIVAFYVFTAVRRRKLSSGDYAS
jgi:hypothetical protein